MRFVRAILMLGAAAAMPALGNLPTWDSSGNSLLNGTYYFREVLYGVGDNAGDVSEALSIYGTITFSGAGGYTIPNPSEYYCSSSGCSGGALAAISGTYTIGANGYGFFTDPGSSSGSVFTEYGLVSSNGTLIASPTENGLNGLFIAVPVTTASVGEAVNSSFQGNYQMAAYFPGSASTAGDASFELNPDGNGNLGTVSMSGYFAGGGSSTYSQTSAGATYSFSNGAANIKLPSNTNANFYPSQSGVSYTNVYLYISPDRNFVFGGSPNGFDMFVGVKTGGATPSLSGLYYAAGVYEDASGLASNGLSDLETYYGSFNAGNGTIVEHQRLYDGTYGFSEGYSYADSYPTPISNGGYNDNGVTQYTVGNGGAVRIGFGIGPFLGIEVAVQAPTLSGSGVYLNPTGVVNAASFTPFTAGVSPGEFIVLYGSGLASGSVTATTLPFPTTLGNVQVKINGINAPIYYVTPTQLAVIVPYGAAYTPASGALAIAQIQVVNNNVSSNTTTQFLNLTTPGIFTVKANGLGYGAIEHANGQVVTPSNPAQPGETVAVYASGLGATLPSVTEGTQSPSSPLANTVQTISATVDSTEATVTYAGLAPYLAGVYQVNVTIPTTATSGDNVVEIIGPDSDNYQALIPVGSSSTTSSVDPGTEQPRVRKPHGAAKKTPMSERPPLPCFNIGPCSTR
jgi:uncharacterized protein (TIGR03437 family)